MEVRSKSYTYRVSLSWKGEKKGIASCQGKPDIEVATPPEFRGHEGFWSPEDLLVSAVNVCIMTTFIALAERAGLGFKSYTSEAEGKLESVEGQFRITEVLIRPRVGLNAAEDRARAEEIFAKAESGCFISNSIRAKVGLETSYS